MCGPFEESSPSSNFDTIADKPVKKKPRGRAKKVVAKRRSTRRKA